MPHPKSGYSIKGKKVPGVTTIISRFKDSGGLLYWAFEQGKAAERGEIASLYDKRDEAADAGTLAHSYVEEYIETGQEPIIYHPDETGEKALQGFRNYLQWQKNNRIQIIKQETELVSELYEFGGCPDAMGIDADGRLCILDWKTSNAIYQDYLIQIAAYRQLWEENFPDKPVTGGYHLLRFSKDHADFAHHYWSELNDAWEQFMCHCDCGRRPRKGRQRPW